MTSLRLCALPAGLMLLCAAVSPATARTSAGIIEVERIARLGDSIGGLTLSTEFGYFDVGALNDSGHLTFVTTDTNDGELLVQFADGKLTPIVSAGGQAPVGEWPQSVRIMPSVQVNQFGNAVYGAGTIQGGQPRFEVFLWNFAAKESIALTQREIPLLGDLVLEGAGLVPVLNNRDETAFVARVTAPGKNPGDGVFFASLGRSQDGRLVPVALPGDSLPDGGIIAEACCPSINDAEMVAFLARPLSGDNTEWSAYLWENSITTPLVRVGADVPGLGKLSHIWSVWLNDQNQSALVEATVAGRDGNGLYTVSEGQITPRAVPGQEMPGGGKLDAVLGISYGNQTGRHAFTAVLEDGTTAVYLLERDGQPSLVLKSGMETNLGTLTDVGPGRIGASDGVALNSRGQIGVTVGIDGEADTLVLITPAAP